MHHLGLDAFIATSIEDFVAKGCYWAEHTSDLAAIRTGLRTRFANSPLGQHEAFANHFEAALRTMWQRWCQGLPPAPLQ
jgi:predicted O-linked N-acetylglucosamine transferase (SPINDLY family)